MSLGARELFEAGRVDAEPSAEARARVRSALVERLGPVAVMAAVSTSASAATGASGAAAGGMTLTKVILVCALGGALSSLGYVAAHRLSAGREAAAARGEPAAVAAPQRPAEVASPDDEVAATVKAPAPVAAPALPVRPKVSAVATPGRASAPPVPRGEAHGETTGAPVADLQASAAPAAAPVDGLQAELALVRAAHDALRAGQPAIALERMDEHRRTYPDGALAEERDALRVCAICALGRTDGAAEAQAFLANHPASPFVARIREACPH